MKKKVYNVNVDAVDDEYKPFVKDEMTSGDIALLGRAIMHNKMTSVKDKLFGWYYERKSKKKGNEKV